jgi:polynucleotide 5'-kinase involved in rRNA processing
MVFPPHLDAIERAAGGDSVMLIGGLDTGKTTLALNIARQALAAGRTVAYVDADIGNSSVGPPACAGLKLLHTPADLAEMERADRLHFVGGLTPERLILQLVVASAALAEAGRRLADLVVVDTTSVVSGVVGETLKYHKIELIRPERVVAVQRGTEMDAIVGMLRRFFSVEVDVLPADPDVLPSSPDVRAANRAARLRTAFEPPLERWRVRPTVFAPTLPLGLDLARLDGVLVGVQDGEGRCLGLGRLEHHEEVLRVVTNAGEGMQGLRLGSLKMDRDSFETRPLNLRQLIFGI